MPPCQLCCCERCIAEGSRLLIRPQDHAAGGVEGVDCGRLRANEEHIAAHYDIRASIVGELRSPARCAISWVESHNGVIVNCTSAYTHIDQCLCHDWGGVDCPTDILMPEHRCGVRTYSRYCTIL